MAEDEFKNTLKWIGYIAIIAIGLTYVFYSGDIIPDALGVIGYIDDASSLVLMFLALAKWRQLITGSRTKPGLGWKGVLVALPIIAAILVYVFWTLDLIPDNVPIMGYVDDMSAILVGVFLLSKWHRYLKGKK